MHILVTPAITENVLQFSCVEHGQEIIFKDSCGIQGMLFPSLLFFTQRNLVGKLSLSECCATGISPLFFEWKKLHRK